jgi:hypothetical protein
MGSFHQALYTATCRPNIVNKLLLGFLAGWRGWAPEPSRVSNRQSRLAESFHSTLKILRVAERQDVAPALDREAWIYLEHLFPGLSAFLRLAEMAIARREKGVGGL